MTLPSKVHLHKSMWTDATFLAKEETAHQHCGSEKCRNTNADTQHRPLHGIRLKSAPWSKHAAQQFITAVFEQDVLCGESLQRKAINVQELGQPSNQEAGGIQLDAAQAFLTHTANAPHIQEFPTAQVSRNRTDFEMPQRTPSVVSPHHNSRRNRGRSFRAPDGVRNRPTSPYVVWDEDPRRESDRDGIRFFLIGEPRLPGVDVENRHTEMTTRSRYWERSRTRACLIP